jgi:hypothetical protein
MPSYINTRRSLVNYAVFLTILAIMGLMVFLSDRQLMSGIDSLRTKQHQVIAGDR